MDINKTMCTLFALSTCLMSPVSFANSDLSAPLQSLIEREVMGSLAAHTALQMQGHLMVLEQIGFGNEFKASQQGFGNRIIALQHGNELSAHLIQVGYGNELQLAQFGSERAITVEQYGNQVVSIEQF